MAQLERALLKPSPGVKSLTVTSSKTARSRSHIGGGDGGEGGGASSWVPIPMELVITFFVWEMTPFRGCPLPGMNRPEDP